MKTSTIILRSNFRYDDEECNKKLQQFFETIANDESYSSQEIDYSQDTFTKCFHIICDSDQKAIELADLIDKHRYKICEGFEEIRPTDYFLDVETDSIDVLRHVQNLNQNFANNQIRALDYIISLQIEELQELNSQVQVLNSFIAKSGLIELSKKYNELIEELHNKGIVENTGAQVYSVVHH